MLDSKSTVSVCLLRRFCCLSCDIGNRKSNFGRIFQGCRRLTSFVVLLPGLFTATVDYPKAFSSSPRVEGGHFQQLPRRENFWDALGVSDAAERSHFLPNCEPA